MSVTVSTTSKDLQILAQELSKSNPNIKLIKNKTEVLGVPYSSDLIILMSEVLMYLSKSKNLQKTHTRQLKEKSV